MTFSTFHNCVISLLFVFFSKLCCIFNSLLGAVFDLLLFLCSLFWEAVRYYRIGVPSLYFFASGGLASSALLRKLRRCLWMSSFLTRLPFLKEAKLEAHKAPYDSYSHTSSEGDIMKVMLYVTRNQRLSAFSSKLWLNSVYSNFTLAVHSPKLWEDKTHFLSCFYWIKR